MLEFGGLNYWAIAAAWLINVMVGSFWYSPAGFGKLWSKYSGVDLMKIPQKEATRSIGFVMVSALVQATALALIINSLHVSTATNGFLVGLTLWVGFVAATTVGTTLYQRLSWRFWWLNAAYFLPVMSINAIILTLWR
jgi:uncharacterized protein DUF1761